MRFPFIPMNKKLGNASLAPLLPIKLVKDTKNIELHGLSDSGASVNVLPFSSGLNLGLNWNAQTTPIRLTGNLANFEARAVLLKAKIGSYPDVQLAFAWTKADSVPLILGMTNFFMEFNICFYRSQLFFEVSPK